MNGRKVSEAVDVAARYASPDLRGVGRVAGGAGLAITVADVATGAWCDAFTAPGNQRWGEFDLDERGNIVTRLGRL